MNRLAIACLALALGSAAHAQVLPFNDAGVTMGHHHIMVPDVEAQRAIWVDALGGEASGNPPLLFVKFPGTFLILSNGQGTEGTKGSAIDHIAFNVRDLAATHEKLAAAGVSIFNESDSRFDATLPGDIEVHFFGDPSLATPIAYRAMAFVSSDPEAQRAWWEAMLGARTTQEGEMTVSTIPGARLFFTQGPAEPTRGRTLDHTGIDVADVGDFCEQLAAKGVECEMLFNGAAAMITDPGGVTIEINAGLENR
jgi:catechol 2,3-dioxygenase-like lactoylglutathione lyase family enzyme